MHYLYQSPCPIRVGGSCVHCKFRSDNDGLSVSESYHDSLQGGYASFQGSRVPEHQGCAQALERPEAGYDRVHQVLVWWDPRVHPLMQKGDPHGPPYLLSECFSNYSAFLLGSTYDNVIFCSFASNIVILNL